MKLALLGALAFSCSCASDPAPPDGDDDPTAPDAGPSAVTRVDCATATIAATITTPGSFYSPDEVTIAVGEVVQISTSLGHDADADDGSFRVDFGETACLRFDAAGTYPFRCNPHQFTGTITVE